MFEEKEKEYLVILISSQNRQRKQLYNYLNFLSCKTDDYRENYLDYKFNFPTPSNEVKNEISEDEIIRKNENFMKFIENEMSDLFKFLEKLKDYIENWSKNYPINKNVQEMYDYYKFHKIKNIKNYKNKEILQRSDLLSIIFKNMMNMKEDSMVRDSIKTDVKFNNIRNKYSINKIPKQNIDIERNNDIKIYFKDYIKNNYKDSPMKLSISIINLTNKNINPKLFLIIQNKKPILKHIQVNIKLYPMNIILGFYLNKELIYNNYKFIFSLKEHYKRQTNGDFILHKKIKALFYERIISILNMIYEEKKRINLLNNIIFDEEYFKEFLKRFIYYIYDYYLINKIKCNLCQCTAKYSNIEKCFFPPFFFLFKEKEISLPNLKNNNNDNDNENKLFFHEECFKKLANPYL